MSVPVQELVRCRMCAAAVEAEKVCPVCGRASKGTFPASVPQAVHYGPVVKTWASYFTNQHHIAVERTTEIFADLVQHRVSEATVLTASEHLEQCIDPATEAVKAMLREAEVLHVDDVRQFVELLDDLFQRCVVAAGGNRHARGLGVLRRPDVERVDVIAAATEKASDPREDPELVLDDH